MKEGETYLNVELRDGLVFGRGREADVQIDDGLVSRRHAVIEGNDNGWDIIDQDSKTGSRVNGRLFHRHKLIFGDVIELGNASFRFDGLRLLPVGKNRGADLSSENLVKTARKRTILKQISLDIRAETFVGILGTSGAGKSTLLDCLSGIRPFASGRVLMNGLDLRSPENRVAFGYVPQDDIVHAELKVAQALNYAARIRLPGDVPFAEIKKLVSRTIEQLGLKERADVVIGQLSGGQRKRVSIAAEVLARPAILFLDEPSSGLDPATESKLMEMLRDLANIGCTVICTTHVMENVYLFDHIIVLTGGRLVYSEAPGNARAHFDIDRFASLYDRLDEHSPEHWVSKYPNVSRRTPPRPVALKGSSGLKPKPPFYLAIMLQRLWSIVSSNPRNLVILLGQPIVIGCLVAWMSDTVTFKLFLAWLATFWFGCSNAAQEIVKEVAIYRRERIVGLGRNAYLLSKFSFWSVVTLAQALVLYVCIQFGVKAMVGSPLWQLSCLAATALSAVGIGCAISALVRTTTQAVMIVPLVLLPQIVFSGFVLPSFTLEGPKKVLCQIMPSYSSQQIMDLSIFWHENLTYEFMREYAVPLKNVDPDAHFKPDDYFDDAKPAEQALVKLLAWVGLTYLVALVALVFKERVD